MWMSTPVPDARISSLSFLSLTPQRHIQPGGMTCMQVGHRKSWPLGAGAPDVRPMSLSSSGRPWR